MVMLNDLDRFHLVMDVIDRVPGLADRAAHLRQDMEEQRLPPGVHARARRGPPGDPRLGVARTEARPRRQRGLDEPEAAPRRRRRAVPADRSIGRADVRGRRAPRRARRHRFVEPSWSTTRWRRRSTSYASSRRSTTRRRSRRSRARERALPDVPHVAVFDTAFHATIPEEAAPTPCPRDGANGASAVTASTGSRSSGRAEQVPVRGSSCATSAAAAR